mmetsp:Transcript_28177/g.83036  ORF Transcript_28177/g.83036 Transcript_28177/m.83036 type:complete len:240 (-) Transcript_28177:390-1109(-)
MLAVHHIVQLHELGVQILDHGGGILGHGLGVQLQLFVHVHARVGVGPVPLPLGLFVGRELMILDEGQSAVELLKFGQESRGDVPRTLEGAEHDLDGFLPRLDVGPARGGGDLIGGAESIVVRHLHDDVEGFHHDEIVLGDFKDGSDLLPHELGGGGNVVVRHEADAVLHVHDPQRQPDPDAEGAVIVHVHDGKIVADDARSLDEGGGLGGGGGRHGERTAGGRSIPRRRREGRRRRRRS